MFNSKFSRKTSKKLDVSTSSDVVNKSAIHKIVTLTEEEVNRDRSNAYKYLVLDL